MSQLESWFERLLWASRFVVLIAVASSLALSFAMFFVASADVLHTIGPLMHYADAGQEQLRAQIVSHVVETPSASTSCSSAASALPQSAKSCPRGC